MKIKKSKRINKFNKFYSRLNKIDKLDNINFYICISKVCKVRNRAVPKRWGLSKMVVQFLIQ